MTAYPYHGKERFILARFTAVWMGEEFARYVQAFIAIGWAWPVAVAFTHQAWNADRVAWEQSQPW